MIRDDRSPEGFVDRFSPPGWLSRPRLWRARTSPFSGGSTRDDAGAILAALDEEITARPAKGEFLGAVDRQMPRLYAALREDYGSYAKLLALKLVNLAVGKY